MVGNLFALRKINGNGLYFLRLLRTNRLDYTKQVVIQKENNPKMPIIKSMNFHQVHGFFCNGILRPLSIFNKKRAINRKRPIFVKKLLKLTKMGRKMKALEWDITTMNDFELKGILLSLIGKAKRQQLVRVFEVLQTDAEIDALPYALTEAQEAELMLSLEESYHEENMMDIEDAKKSHARWL